MCNNQTATIEHIVTDESVEKFCSLLAKFRRLFFEFLEGFDDAVCQLDILAAQFAKKLDVVIAWDTKSIALSDHLHDET